MTSQGKVETLLKITQGSKVEIRIGTIKRILNKVGHRPVSIYSINGQTRTGKSFILNCILKFLHFNRTNPDNWIEQKLDDAFVWNGNAERVTSGIEIWSEPIFVNCDGKEIAVLLLDTQGLYDGVTSMQDNHNIFAFSALLSSCMINNNMEKDMNEKTWQFLDLLINFVNLGTQRASSLENHESSSSLALNLLIRDWSNKKEFDFGHHSKEKFPSKNGGGNIWNKYFSLDSGEESIRCRMSILKNFRTISIDLLPYPGDELVQDNYNPSSWDSRFLNHLIEYITNHFSNTAILANQKRIGRAVVTGSKMVETVQKWAKIFENVNQPGPRSIYEVTAKLQHAQAVSTLVEEFSKKITEMLNKAPDGIQHFDQASGSLKYECLSNFQTCKLLGQQEFSHEFSVKLIEKLDADELHFKALNNGKLQNSAYRKEQENVSREAEIARLAHEQQLKRLQEETNIINERNNLIAEDLKKEAEINSGSAALGLAITCQVVRVNDQRMFDYTLGTGGSSNGAWRLSSLTKPVRNIYIVNDRCIQII